MAPRIEAMAENTVGDPEHAQSAEAFLGQGVEPKGLVVPETTTELLDVLRQGMVTVPFTVSDGVHNETVPGVFWNGPRVSFHRPTALIPETNREVHLAHAIASGTRKVGNLAREVVITEKLIAFWGSTETPGGNDRLIPLAIKRAALQARLKLAESALVANEARANHWNIVAYDVVADLNQEVEERIVHQQPITQEWFHDRRDALVQQYAPPIAPRADRQKPADTQKGRKTRDSSPPITTDDHPAQHYRVPTLFKVAAIPAAIATALSLPACTLVEPGASLTPLPPSATPRPTANEASPTPKPTDVPSPSRPGSGGEYDPAIWDAIQRGDFKPQEDALKQAVQYWGSAGKDRPFSNVALPNEPGQSASVHYVYLADRKDPTNPKKVKVVLQSNDYPNYYILTPLDLANGTFMDTIPLEQWGHTVPDYLKPTFLSMVGQEGDGKMPAGLVDSVIAWEDWGFIRVDSEGKMVGGLDLKTGKWVEGYTVLSPEALAERKLVGDAIRVETEYEGIPVDATLVTSPSLQKFLPSHIGFGLNPLLMDNELPAPQRLAKLVLLGHYRGYLEDTGETYDAYPFAQYIADLKAGKDLRYYIWGTSMVGSSGRFRVDPLQPIETVFVADKTDPNGNANVYIAEGFSYGLYVNKAGGIRLTALQEEEKIHTRPVDFPLRALGDMGGALYLLGWPEKAQHYGSIYGPRDQNTDPVFKQMGDIGCPTCSQKGYYATGDPLILVERTGE